MLSNQLRSRAEIPSPIASHALLASHQQVDEVVDHDRHLDAINGDKHRPILREGPVRTNATQNRDAASDSDAHSAAPRYSSDDSVVLVERCGPGRYGDWRRTPARANDKEIR